MQQGPVSANLWAKKCHASLLFSDAIDGKSNDLVGAERTLPGGRRHSRVRNQGDRESTSKPDREYSLGAKRNHHRRTSASPRRQSRAAQWTHWDRSCRGIQATGRGKE